MDPATLLITVPLITGMWAAFKALLQQEGSCAPSSRAPPNKTGDLQCEPRTALEQDDFTASLSEKKGSRSHRKKRKEATSTIDTDANHSVKMGSKSQLKQPTKSLVDIFGEHSKENGPNPNCPLPHVKSPAETPCQIDDRAPRIEAQAWRIRAAEPKALSVWEVRRLLFYEPGKETCSNGSLQRMNCSGSASDDSWGQLPGWEMRHALGGVNTTGHGWGGRPDDNREIWLGAEWGTPLQIERVKILQGEKRGPSFRSRNRGPTTADSVFIEAQFEDKSWGLVAGPVPLNADGWTTIRLCCAGAKRRRANSIQEFVPTPALRIASPSEAAPSVSDKESRSPSSASTAPESTSSVKKASKAPTSTPSVKRVTFANDCDSKAFPSLGL